MSLFCEFGLLTKYCTHCFDDGFSGVRWAANTQQQKNQMCRFVCLRKSDCSQGLSVMRIDMGTINSFCLDDGVHVLPR